MGVCRKADVNVCRKADVNVFDTDNLLPACAGDPSGEQFGWGSMGVNGGFFTPRASGAYLDK